MNRKETIDHLKALANEQRVLLVRLSESFNGNIHLGGDLSMTDVLVALYHYGMHVSPKQITMKDRDRFVLSKGHAAACMYVTMSLCGFFDFDDILNTYGQLDSAYGMHPCKIRLPGVECSSGSLGQGLSMAVGMAMMAQRNKEAYRVFCLMGDGETCEGSVWEAAMCASSYRLGNLVAVLDRNYQMMTSFTEQQTMHLEPYADKWRAFGWSVIEIADGNDMEQIIDAIDHIGAMPKDKPVALVCNTVKGKGISFMERQIAWHAGNLSKEQAQVCYNELAGQRRNAQ